MIIIIIIIIPFFSDMVVRVQGQVLNTGLAITGNWPVSQLGTRYSVNLLDTPAALTQGVVHSKHT